MYAAYLKERENKEILQNEHGFAIYGFNCVPGVDFPHVYLQDIYIVPHRRKSGLAREMSDWVAEKARNKGIKKMLGSVDTNANNAHASLQAVMAYGMTLHASDDSTIWLIKDL